MNSDERDQKLGGAHGVRRLAHTHAQPPLLLALACVCQCAVARLLASLALRPAPRLDAHSHFAYARAGDIAVAFFVLGAPIALLVGALTDSFNRRNLFVAVIALGEGPCLATAYVKTYPQLFAMRALTGISIGGSLPLLYSLLGDLVPPARRSAVSAGVGIAQGAGIALGQILAGYLGSQYGWRRVRCGVVRALGERGCTT
jgi:MFS family permease